MRTKANRDLTLRQRTLVSREISNEYDAWRRKKGEPTEAQRRQIVAIGFAKARRKDRRIPKGNPIDIGTKLFTDIIGGIGFGVGAGITERYIMGRRKNPIANPPRFAVLDPEGTIVYTKSATGTGDVALRAAHQRAHQLARKHGTTYFVWLSLRHKVGDQLNLALLSDAYPIEPVPEHNPRRRTDSVDALIEQAYYRYSSGTQISIMDIPKLFRDVKLEVAGGTDMNTAVQNAITRYQANPLTTDEGHEILDDSIREGIRGGQIESPGSRGYHLGRSWAMRDIVDQYGPFRENPLLMTVLGANPKRKRRRKRKTNPFHTRRLKNPGRSKKKITMSIQKFWAHLKSKGDSRLLAEFKKKIEGYRKWTHGTMPKSVTLELKNVPGMSGIWMTYGMGNTPESTYMMPKGSKRKGAWKHEWENHPKLMGDPESGLIVTQMVKGNKLTDFMHG